MLIETTLVATDKSHREAFSVTIPDAAWQRLMDFDGHVQTLNASAFVQKRRGGHIGLEWKSGQRLRSDGREVGNLDEVHALFHVMRPFLLTKERCFLPKTIDWMKEYLEHNAFRRELNNCRRMFCLLRLEGTIQLPTEGRQPLSYQVVMDWMNAHAYHFDERKQEVVAKDLSIFGESQKGLSTILVGVTEMAQAVLQVGRVVRTLQGCLEGTLHEIQCPPDYFVTRGTSE